MKRTTRSLPGVFFLALLTSGLLLAFTAPPSVVQAAKSEKSEANIDKMMAGLSDEQVRQLLIEELKKETEAEEVDPDNPDNIKGPAFFLSRLLSIMTRGHDENTDEVRALFGSFSTLGPELYRVFIKL